MVKILKNGQRIVTMPYIGDIEFFSDINEPAVDQESVPVIGAFTEELLHGEITSGGVPTKQQMYSVGLSNKLQGTDAGLRGKTLGNLNVVGETTDIFRRRKKVITMEVNDAGK